VNRRSRRRLQCAAAAVLIAGYAGLSHYCNLVGAHALGAALALSPVTVLAVILAWRSTSPPVAVLLTLGIGGLLFSLWPQLQQKFTLIYLVQESGVYGLLGLTFGRSLLSNRLALCTQMADRVHGPLSPREVLYTRRVTLAWTVFFFAVVTVSILLYSFTPSRIWSLYINFCVPALVGAMFLAEYWVRRRALPETQRASLLATVQVYFAPSHVS
jgi:uncharacterized membrane protein